jgi:hypothetical protein
MDNTAPSHNPRFLGLFIASPQTRYLNGYNASCTLIPLTTGLATVGAIDRGGKYRVSAAKQQDREGPDA